MIEPFSYSASPGRVIFGIDTLAELPTELSKLAARRALIVCTAQQIEQARSIQALLGDAAVAIFSGASMHTPVDVTSEAMQVVKENRIDCLVGVGGGSTIGLCKAIALGTGLPQIAIPTTYAGSEMTPILGQTENGVKTTLRDEKVRPQLVIYDVRLTLTLPVPISGASGMNAIAHAAEALYAKNRNPLTSSMAEEGIALLSGALPKISSDSQDMSARSDALCGAWLCGSCLASVGMALHHKLCHTLGGSFDLPHAETHAAMLPHAVAYNAAADPAAMQRIARALECESAPHGLYELAHSVGARPALKELGLKESELDRAADIAVQNPYWNPRPLDRNEIRELLQRAWSGGPPAT